MPAGISLGLILRHGQRLLAYPFAWFDHYELNDPSSYGEKYEDLQIETSDHVKLHCYLIHCSGRVAKPCTRTAIVFHGNAMNIGTQSFSGLNLMQAGCHVLLVSYRGYAGSEGTPSEGGLRKDSQAALDYVLKHPTLRETSIIVYGLSLGGAVAIDLVSRNPDKVSALVVENTFLSLPAIVKGWPYIGRFSFLCTQKWNSAKKIGKIPRTIPILMLSGLRDRVVPPAHMAALWELAQKRGMKQPSFWVWKSTPSEPPIPLEYDMFRTFKYGEHPDTFTQRGFWEAVRKFLNAPNQPAGNAPDEAASSTESDESSESSSTASEQRLQEVVIPHETGRPALEC